MIEVDLREFTQILAMLGELYHINISEHLCEIYWSLLNLYPIDAVRQAVLSHINHPEYGRYMPKPADIKRELEGTFDERAQEAWISVIHAVKRIGRYQSVAFEDGLINQVISELGGWSLLCNLNESAFSFYANKFCQRYSFYLRKVPTVVKTHLAGLAEMNNASLGCEVGELIRIPRIGDREDTGVPLRLL